MRASRPERAAARKKGMRIMSRKGIPVLFLVSLLCLLASSCADRDAARTKTASGRPRTIPNGSRRSSKNRASCGSSSRSGTRSPRARSRETSRAEQIREAGYDVARSNELLGLTEAERRARFERIDALINSLYARYPALREAEAREAAAFETCDIECAASSWERYSKVLAVELSGDGTPALRAPAQGSAEVQDEADRRRIRGCAP